MEHGENSLLSDFILGRVVLFFAVFFFFSNSWADCWREESYFGTFSGKSCGGTSTPSCRNGYMADYAVSGCYSWEGSDSKYGYCYYGSMGCSVLPYTVQCCNTSCEAEQISCENRGGSWANTGASTCNGYSCEECDAECQCEEEGGSWVNGDCEFADSTACDSYKQECEGYGGKFTGNVVTSDISPTGCLSFCDMCTSKATELFRKNLAYQCCSKGQVPPEDVTRCINQSNAPSPDMSFSNFECRAGFDCGCEQLSSDNASTYNQICNDDNWSSDSNSDNSSDSNNDDPSGGSSDSEPGSSASPGSDSSGPGDSSNSSGPGGGSSDSSGPGGPGDEGEPYDYRDSLHKIIDNTKNTKKAAEGILLCLLEPINCEALNFPVFQFDTAFLKYIRPLMDSSLRIDSNQLKALMKLDTNMLKSIRNDSAILENDSATRRIISGGFGGIDSTLKAENDTTRKWLNRIADSIGVTSDSLAAHLDSILRHIPDSVLDSIIKYQAYANDNFDSVLFGKGKGFSLVDSLIDSAVKYFQISNHYDSVYRVMFRDFEDGLTDEFSDLPGRNASAIGDALGYGDTASTNLRGDLEGIRDAIEGLGDTNGLGGHGGGYGDSLGRYRDSINKYYISDGRFGELVDSTEAAWGVDSLDARWDSSYAYGLCEGNDCPPCSDDSCMGSLSGNFVQRADSIARIAGDSLEASTKRQRDSLPTFWDSTFKELKDYSWFGSFDSTFLANIGAKIPNSNTCPEHCFAQDINGTYAYVGYNMHLDWKLCRPIAPNVLNSLNAFDLLKLIARILTVFTCLSILMWEVSSRRGGGIGL